MSRASRWRLVAPAMAVALLAGCQGEGGGTVSPATVTPAELVEDAARPADDDAGTTSAALGPTPSQARRTGSDDTASTSTDGAAAGTARADDETDGGSAAITTTQAAPTSSAADAEGQVTEVRSGTTFTTPAQAAFCSLAAPSDGMGAVVSCEVMQSTVPPGEELIGTCSTDGYGFYVNFFADTGHGGFGCNHHDGITNSGGIDFTAGEGWVDPGQVATLPDGARVGILPYGHVLRAGSLSCSVQPEGLTCNSPSTGHGFTLNTASYTSW